jgi:hypothetical protein
MPKPTLKTLFCSALLAASISFYSCSRSADHNPVFADTLLDKAVVIMPNGGLSVYQFHYGADHKLAEVRSQKWLNGLPRSTVWSIKRDGSGNMGWLKAYNSVSSDTTITQFGYNSGYQLESVITKVMLKDHAGEYSRDSIDFSGTGNTTTSMNLSNHPYLCKTEFALDNAGNLASKTIYTGYANTSVQNMAFNSAVDYTYDDKNPPLRMEHCEIFNVGFRDEYFRSIANNVLTETYRYPSTPQQKVNHLYTYNDNGQPVTQVIARPTGDSVKIYYYYH